MIAALDTIATLLALGLITYVVHIWRTANW
jgi:hypothetical protein